MNSYHAILAKSANKDEQAITLVEHIDDCLALWVLLQKLFPQIVTVSAIPNNFWEILRNSIIFHDLGKAHQEFQKLLKNELHKWKKQRHELFSLPFVEAFEEGKDQLMLMKYVIAGHHKPLNKLSKDFIEGYASEIPDDFALDSKEKNGLDYYEEFTNNINVDVIQQMLKEKYSIILSKIYLQHPETVVRPYLRNTNPLNINGIKHIDYLALLLLVGAFKHCDHLGSARVKELGQVILEDFDFLNIKQQKLKSKEEDFYKHQIDCSKTNGNVILTAPTGSGKTESAMLWLRKQMQVFGQGRVFYVLPFTASINAMFERLGDNEDGLGNDKVGMLHGKLNFYLDSYFDDYQYSVLERKEKIKEIRDKFRTIHTPVKVVTPFQLLKHLFGLKGYEQGIFEWVGGYFIFDEIHAYSPEVFAQIEVLLEYITKYLNAKVMIMTATLPTFLKKEIQAAIQEYTPVQANRPLYQRFNRHQIILQPGLLADNLDLIANSLKAGEKVLVICNTVKQAQKVFRNLRKYAKKAVLLHSAFNGVDRNRHENTLKDGEKEGNESIQLLVGTQAIEVSLDIDYDKIYTEPAPLDALIQRFGRVNRKREKGISPVIVFEESNPNDKYIYNPVVVTDTISELRTITTKSRGMIEEIDLQQHMDNVYPKWSDKDLEKHDTVYNRFSCSVKKLIPLHYSKDKEEEFYQQFDGIKVLPVALKDKFTQLLNDFDFIRAESLKVQIRKQKFAQLINENDQNLQKMHHFVESKTKLISIEYFIITKKYDPEYGLDYDEQEVWQDDIIV